MEWKLTDQELDELRVRGSDIAEAQRAKRQAYLKAQGGGETMEYTKGEWKVGESGYSVFGDNKEVAYCYSHETSKEEQLANAQLIASAPRMHKAIVEALEKSHNPKVERILMEAIKDVA